MTMKKVYALLMTLCLLCTASALAEAPKFADMPAMVTFDSFFEGDWVAGATFAGETYVDPEALAAAYHITIPAVTIGDGVVVFTGTNENGEAVTEEYPYILENSQLECQDNEGQSYIFELHEDFNISLTVFVPGEGEETIAVTIFMVRADAQ